MMTELQQRIAAVDDAIYEEVAGLRHVLHAHPDLSRKEYGTAAFLEKTLSDWGVHCHHVPDTAALIADIQGGLPGKQAVGIRADMDALPVTEAASCPFVSENQGVMHACGHDIHMANLLGTARILLRLRDSFAGTVRIVFQPAEEVGRGALEILRSGVLQEPPVKAFLAMHVSAELAAGEIRVKPEEATLSAQNFAIKLTGSGGHASTPHLTGDIILAASKIVCALQSVTSRRISHLEPAVITVASIHGGTCNNVIPQELTMLGTIRAQNDSLQPRLCEAIRDILRAQEIVSGVHGELVLQHHVPSVYNDPVLTERFLRTAVAMVGVEHAAWAKFPFNAAENFACFAHEVPSVFFRLGVSRDPAHAAPLHNAGFCAEDSALRNAMRVTAAAALDFLDFV